MGAAYCSLDPCKDVGYVKIEFCQNTGLFTADSINIPTEEYTANHKGTVSGGGLHVVWMY
jgi:hypothetical protein